MQICVEYAQQLNFKRPKVIKQYYLWLIAQGLPQFLLRFFCSDPLEARQTICRKPANFVPNSFENENHNAAAAAIHSTTIWNPHLSLCNNCAGIFMNRREFWTPFRLWLSPFFAAFWLKSSCVKRERAIISGDKNCVKLRTRSSTNGIFMHIVSAFSLNYENPKDPKDDLKIVFQQEMRF